MKELTGDSGLVVVQGEIFKKETKELKGGEMLLLTFCVTDYTSSILCKQFLRYRPRFARKEEGAEPAPITDEERQAVMDKVDRIKKGMAVRLRGECLYDNFARELSITVRDLMETEKEEREDTAEEKRVELHMHTNMSTMDALTSAEDLIARAAKWGHPAVAITDHGVLQAFPAAFNAAKKNKIRLIPGCEGYLVDQGKIVPEADGRAFDGPIIVLDFESTGLNTGTTYYFKVLAAAKGDGLTFVGDLSAAVTAKVK
jgi:DNA polymerase-3 subunit alpha (Gram-positive type)